MMDGDTGVICHLQCEISSVSVTGLGRCCGGELFLRCHIPAGGGRAIQIYSRGAEQQPDGAAGGGETAGGGSAAAWRDVASLSCDGSPACVRELLEQSSIVFEVRRRRWGRAALLGRVLGFELVGRAEVPWRDDDAAGDNLVAATVVERRVDLEAPSGRRVRGKEAPVLSATISVRVSETVAPARRRPVDSSPRPHRESGCEWSVGEDVFAAVAFAVDDAFE